MNYYIPSSQVSSESLHTVDSEIMPASQMNKGILNEVDVSWGSIVGTLGLEAR